MKIYTKKGDAGETSLLGGTRVPKYHLRIETYGSVDELNSWIGLLRDKVPSAADKEYLKTVQEQLFVVGSLLAEDPEASRMQLPPLEEAELLSLEKEIDRMEESLPPLRQFILPGGHPTVSFCHIARCVCRRAERLVVRLAEESRVNGLIIRYMNRLSDYLFVLARKLAVDVDAEEYPWQGRARK